MKDAFKKYAVLLTQALAVTLILVVLTSIASPMFKSQKLAKLAKPRAKPMLSDMSFLSRLLTPRKKVVIPYASNYFDRCR